MSSMQMFVTENGNEKSKAEEGDSGDEWRGEVYAVASRAVSYLWTARRKEYGEIRTLNAPESSGKIQLTAI